MSVWRRLSRVIRPDRDTHMENAHVTRLIIDYKLDGPQRGYTLNGQSASLPDDVLKGVWRAAMPRGSGWSAYVGARSIKAFPLPGDRFGVSQVTVTDRQDENGRRGIRHATVDVMSAEVYALHLRSRWQSYPPAVQDAAYEEIRRLTRNWPRPGKRETLGIFAPYDTQRGWWLVEAVVIALVLAPPRPLQKLEPPLSFTTLALKHQKESRLVAMPSADSVGLSVAYLDS